MTKQWNRETNIKWIQHPRNKLNIMKSFIPIITIAHILSSQAIKYQKMGKLFLIITLLKAQFEGAYKTSSLQIKKLHQHSCIIKTVLIRYKTVMNNLSLP
jgi:hypothetical protein